jgi:hypothetical protein
MTDSNDITAGSAPFVPEEVLRDEIPPMEIPQRPD